jgi:hypothetical protein
LVCALVAVSAAPSSAETAPCWKRVTLDWAADGRVATTYPISCYTEAIDHMSTTMELYSSFEDDVRRAQQRAIAEQRSPQGADRSAAPKPASDDGDSVPLPLLVLGGVAILLVGAGAVGMFRRRSGGSGPANP